MLSKYEEMRRAAAIAKPYGYEVRAYAGDYTSVDLVKEVRTGHGGETVLIGLTLYRKADMPDGPRWNAEVNHMPYAGMVVVRSLLFSWPHKSFVTIFEDQVTTMALLYAASKNI